ncbi:DNA cytosine methyltransferase [Latilactobacillus sakei]|uniref:DNA cytosine methyltransferase n=1 Tax=Latilactobacillus sakei TaxID=1599 RepID=UPI001F2751D5|nr:DNA cytosine methyltransferase [Latilactobacillus sakei]MCE8501643.1 DNA cytosine methyltransferase [Latilactobacillus sakei]UNC19684.1 DNA cytosine methyltransferase [Latilactobacillus sakei]
MEKRLNNIELFAGAGGLLDGFEQTGKYNLLGAVEWLKPQCRTLVERLENKYNDPKASEKVLNFDIQRTNELINGWDDDTFGTNDGLASLVANEEVDVLSGGPPCQAYSLAGRIRDNNGMKDDYRNFLFEAYVRVVQHYKPKIIVFENVEGILSAIPTGEKITDLIRREFDAANYEIVDDLRKYALLDLSEFGVPQKRKRVIIIGIRRDYKDIDYQEILHEFYINTISTIKEKQRTVRDAIGDLPSIKPLLTPIKHQSHENISNINGHYSRFHNERDQEIFYDLAKNIQEGTNKYSSSADLINLYYQKTGKHTNVHKYHVLDWNEPSTTIPAHLKKDGLRHIHPDPDQKRSITVREAARIQTFSDDFMFKESMGASFEMIGNAVPPYFAKKLGVLVYKLYSKLEHIEKRNSC